MLEFCGFECLCTAFYVLLVLFEYNSRLRLQLLRAWQHHGAYSSAAGLNFHVFEGGVATGICWPQGRCIVTRMCRMESFFEPYSMT